MTARSSAPVYVHLWKRRLIGRSAEKPGMDFLKGFYAIGRGADIITRVFEQTTETVPFTGVVIDHENLVHKFLSLRWWDC
jgi:hypothetical protein